MKKKQSTVKLECDYEKVFLNTLDWCPLFGYLPNIFNSSIAKHPIIIYYDKVSHRTVETSKVYQRVSQPPK